MQKDQSDLELIFKKRARRRLVGAIALVLLMVILLPIVLEDRAETNVNEEIAIVMPQGNGASDDEHDLMLAEGEEVLDLPKQQEAASQEMVPEQPAPKKQAKAEKPKVEEPKVVEKPVAKITPKPEPKPEPKAVEKKSVPKKETTSSQTITKEAGNQFYVQIGVFSNIDNVKKLQVKLDELGYQSVTEKITTETGEKTRLRTKNFDERNEAAIALANIKDAGLTGMVVSQK